MNRNDCGMPELNECAYIRVGYANVPFQKLGRVYTPEKAISQGTVFPELDISIGEYERGLNNG